MPTVSLVIPVYNAADQLRSCLEAVRQSAVPCSECIVIDDGSTDASARVAAEFGAKVLKTGGRKGPAYARNLGAQSATGDILFFVDADVCVHRDTIQRIVDNFTDEPDLDALIGSYDDAPGSRDFISIYRNLMHSFVHQNGRRTASTFWSGCGAIRRAVFLEHKGFDEEFGRPAIEDIELGYRMSIAGRKLVLDRDVQVKHLKRWTFLNLLKTDIFDRAIPWTELILSERRMPNDLNLQVSQRISVALAFLLFGLATIGALYYGGFFLIPVMAILFLMLACYWVEIAPASGATRTALSLTVACFSWMAYTHHMLGLIPPVMLGYLLLFLRHRYAYSSEKRRRMTGLAYAAYTIMALVLIVTFLPVRTPVLLFFLIVFLIVVLNNQFYIFLGSRMGWLSTIAVIPFHLLYHFYSGIAFVVAVAKHTWTAAVISGMVRPASNHTRR